MLEKEIFPREVTSGVPYVMLTGRELLHVEQHRGLVACSEEEITLRTACGLLTVSGTELHMRCYSAQTAMIAGKISGLTLQPEGRRR